MKSKSRLILIAAVVIAAVVFVYRRPLILRVVGMRPFVDERFGGWVHAGATEAELDTALRAAYDPLGSAEGSWVFELSQPGARHEQLAQQAEQAGDLETARKEYQEAAVFYYVARFPFVGSPAKQAAYEKHIECYLKATALQQPPLEVVRIPHEGKEIIGYLRVPPGPRPPVVVMTGGVDTWKSDVEDQAQAMLDEGLAVFTFDMPGTGESAWPLTPDGDAIYARVIEYLKTRPEIDGERLGVYLQSFAGYFAVKLAVTNPDVMAAVNIGGPIHHSFLQANITRVPAVMVKTIAHGMGEDPNIELQRMLELSKLFSLGEQGLLQKPARQAALLSINGDLDPLVAIEDLYVISKSGIAQEEWVYEGDGHCAPENAHEHVPKSAAWLKTKLTAPQPAPAPVAAATAGE